MGRVLYRLMTALALLCVGGEAFAQLPPEGRTAILPALIAEGGAPASGGRVTLAITMRPAPGWHGYWKNPGDAGVATRVEWTLPPGARAGALRYPVPGRLTIAGLMNYVYEADYAHLVTLDVPAAPAGSVLPIRAHMEWLACTDQVCVPEKGELALDLPVGDGGVTPASAKRFDAFRRALPSPLATPATFQVTDGRLRMSVPLSAGSAPDPYFFPEEGAPVRPAAAQKFSSHGDRLVMDTVAGKGATMARMSGVLALGNGRGLEIVANPGRVAVPAASDGLLLATLLAFAGAVAGGLILNVMPCVFPILSLKALGLAKAGGSERDARRDAVAYAGGAVLTCAALGAVLLALRASGEAVGWAFQLQEPRVILVLLLITVGIALNLAGLFEVRAVTGGGTLAARGGTVGSFWTGALAAFVATPCTGPFLGAALGALLVLPPAAAMAVFVGLGLGLALPFLLLGFVPALRRRLPAPGPWMERLRRLLSLPMFATALALAWVLGRQSGVAGMTIGVGAALVVALVLWWLGQRQRRESGRAWLPVVTLLAAALSAIVVLPRADANAGNTTADAAALRFDPARLAALRAQGRPVFLYFTADWCVTCKVNERIAIRRDEVEAAFARAHVAVMVGDWTNGDPAIGRFLESRGRSGVPLYLYYAPGRDARVLPQLLSVGLLTGLVDHSL